MALTYTLFYCFTKRGICIDKSTNNEYNFFKFTNCGLKIDIDKDTKKVWCNKKGKSTNNKKTKEKLKWKKMKKI